MPREAHLAIKHDFMPNRTTPCRIIPHVLSVSHHTIPYRATPRHSMKCHTILHSNYPVLYVLSETLKNEPTKHPTNQIRHRQALPLPSPHPPVYHEPSLNLLLVPSETIPTMSTSKKAMSQCIGRWPKKGRRRLISGVSFKVSTSSTYDMYQIQLKITKLGQRNSDTLKFYW